MAVFSYRCEEHGEFKKRLTKREKLADCPVCGKASLPVLRAGSMQHLEKLDNGAMVRAIERLQDIDEIMEERELNHKKRLGKLDDQDD